MGRALVGSSSKRLKPAEVLFPNADPEYDEARIPDAADLAAKYGYKWMMAAGLQRTRAPRNHPLLSVTVRHADSSMDVFRAHDLRPLQPGCPLYAGGEATLVNSHAQLPPDLHYFPANMFDWGTAEPRYITVHFACRGRLYVLLPENTVEPRWLHKHFFKLREPLYGVKVQLRMQWRSKGLTDVVHRIMTITKGAGGEEGLLVYKSKRVYHAADEVRLGGLPSAHLSDNMYVVGACCEEEEDDDGRTSARPTDIRATDNFRVWNVWHARMIKAIRRNRLEDVKMLLNSDAWRMRAVRGDPLTWLPPEEVGPDSNGSALTTDLAAATNNLALLALLVAECNCQLSTRGLRMLLRKWEEVPLKYGGGQGMLLDYLRRSKRPLGAVACFLTALRYEVAERDRARTSSTLELRAALRQFTELQTCLLEALSEAARTGGDSGAPRDLAWLQGVLDPPRAHTRVLCEHSPLRIAFEDSDYSFMATAVMEGYTRQKWLGSMLLSLTPRDGTRELTVLDPLVLHTVMTRLGLCQDGPVAMALEKTTRLWFLSCVVPTAFISSPRGRWWMRLTGEIFFIVVYNIGLRIDANLHPAQRYAFSIVLVVLLGGTIVEAVEVAGVRHYGKWSKFMKRNPHDFAFLLADTFILALTLIHVLQNSRAITIAAQPYQDLVLVWASMAVYIYVKFLYTLIPIFQRLGPLLNTVQNMLGELQGFLLPFLVITTGFATTYSIVYRAYPTDGYSNFVDAMLSLYQAFLGSFSLNAWDNMPTASLRIFGIAIMVIYLVLASILLANLLIAIITYKYRPEEVAAQSVFGLAEVVDKHQVQVDAAFLPTPFCLLQAPFNLLPTGTRPAILPYTFFRWGLPPLEGFRPAVPSLNTVPTGRAAAPQLIFNLTLHPLMLVMLNVAYYCVAPFSILHFVIYGHEQMVKGLWPVGRLGGGAKANGSRRKQGDSALEGDVAGSNHGNTMLTRLRARTGSGQPSLPAAGGEGSSGNADSFAADGAQADPWTGLSSLFTLRGLGHLAAKVTKVALSVFVGLFLSLGAMGLFIITLGSIYVWAVSVCLSTYNVVHEPVVRISRSLGRLWSGRKRRSSVAPVTSDGPGPGPGHPGGEGAEVGGPGGVDRRGSAVRAWQAGKKSLMAAKVTHQWNALAKSAAVTVQKRVSTARYLSRPQVEAAIMRVFGAAAVQEEAASKAELSTTRKSTGAAGGGQPQGLTGSAKWGDVRELDNPHISSLLASLSNAPHKRASQQGPGQAQQGAGQAEHAALLHLGAPHLLPPSRLGPHAGAGVGGGGGGGGGAVPPVAGLVHVAAQAHHPHPHLPALPELLLGHAVGVPDQGLHAAAAAAAAPPAPAAAAAPAADAALLAAAVAQVVQSQLMEVEQRLSARFAEQAEQLQRLQEQLDGVRAAVGINVARLQQEDAEEERRRSVLARAYGDEKY